MSDQLLYENLPQGNASVSQGATSTFTAQELIDFDGAFNIRAKSAITLDRAIVRLV